MSDELEQVNLGIPVDDGDDLAETDGFVESTHMAVVQVHGMIDTEGHEFKQHAGDSNGSAAMMFATHDDALAWVKWMVLEAHGGDEDHLSMTVPMFVTRVEMRDNRKVVNETTEPAITHVTSDLGPTHGYVIAL